MKVFYCYLLKRRFRLESINAYIICIIKWYFPLMKATVFWSIWLLCYSVMFILSFYTTTSSRNMLAPNVLFALYNRLLSLTSLSKWVISKKRYYSQSQNDIDVFIYIIHDFKWTTILSENRHCFFPSLQCSELYESEWSGKPTSY